MKIKIPVQKLFLAIIVLYLLFLIRPALFGQLGGTFKPTKIPDEYIKLKDFIYSQNTFFRTFWIPTTQRFGYSSNLNPSINAQTFLKTTDYPEIFKKMQSEETKNLLQESVVKYVIVPYDSKGEIFLEDRRYNDKLYKQTRDKIGNISYLKKVSDFGRIAVFELSDYRDHFWNPDNSLDISYQYKNPTKYFVSVEDAGKGDLLVFSESFDKNWVIKNSDFRVVSSKFNDRFNSFELPKSGNYTFEVYYTPQDWVNIGVGISVLTLLSVIGSLIYLKRK